jgi:flagellin
VAQLQIMDGGMNNISKMLDRLKTLATQSASATFTGHFAAKMGVYIGGGTTAAGTADTANGTVNLDLSNSTVDTKALGLRTADFEVDTVAGADIGAGSATSVAAIATANNATDSGMATFNLSGPGFSGVSGSVDITGMTQPQSVADAINSAIAAGSDTDTNLRWHQVFSSTASAFQVQGGTATANALLGNFKTGATTPGTGADQRI